MNLGAPRQSRMGGARGTSEMGGREGSAVLAAERAEHAAESPPQKAPPIAKSLKNNELSAAATLARRLQIAISEPVRKTWRGARGECRVGTWRHPSCPSGPRPSRQF